MNCSVRRMDPILVGGLGDGTTSLPGPGASARASGALRIKKAAGMMKTAVAKTVNIIASRQPKFSINTVASGVMVIGATPAPSESGETARLRYLSNQPNVVAIKGAKTAPTRPS